MVKRPSLTQEEQSCRGRVDCVLKDSVCIKNPQITRRRLAYAAEDCLFFPGFQFFHLIISGSSSLPGIGSRNLHDLRTPCSFFSRETLFSSRMFRTKRSGLVRRLWRSRAPAEGDGEADRGTHGTGGCCMGKTTKVVKSTSGSDAELKALTHSILKKIKEKQLEVLLQAVESKGGARSPCLLLPSKMDAKVGQQCYSLPLLLYKVFRWPDLRHSSELKRLPCCESYGKTNPELVCCNPHHMSRLCELGEQCQFNLLSKNDI